MSMDLKLPAGTVRHPIMFESRLIQNGGLLPAEKGAHACWYFCRIAVGHLERFDEGAIYEGEPDPSNGLFNVAKGVALAYDLDSPDDFLKFMSVCRKEAIRSGLHWDSRLEDPFNIKPLPRIIQ